VGDTTLFEYAGGEAAFLRLAAANHQRCLDDPVLNHPFSRMEHPDHVERLAAYWAEVFGGPTRFSDRFGGHTAMLDVHAGIGEVDADLGDRFVACFLGALDDAGLPEDPAFRSAMRAYIEWATTETLGYAPEGSQVPQDLPMPRWGWEGPAS
jgi:hemoglobin